MRPRLVPTIFATGLLSIGFLLPSYGIRVLQYIPKATESPPGGWGLLVFGPLIQLAAALFLPILAIILLVMGGGTVITGFGLLWYKEWARRLAIVYGILWALFGISLLFSSRRIGTPTGPSFLVLNIGLSVLMVLYCVLTPTKEAFQEEGEGIPWVRILIVIVLAGLLNLTPRFFEKQKLEKQEALQPVENLMDCYNSGGRWNDALNACEHKRGQVRAGSENVPHTYRKR